MTDCSGIMGKIFGHCYIRYILKPKIDRSNYLEEKINIEGLSAIQEYWNSKRDIYEIRCKRCGRRADE